MSQKVTETSTRVHVENVGGISTDDIELFSGVNILAGENATNRTSFLKSLAAAQGSSNVSLKGDKTEGVVELTYDDDVYRRRIRRSGDELRFEGDTLVADEDTVSAELFAFLFERNPARQAIRQNADLREVVMQPVDTEEIQDQIASLKQRRAENETELEELTSLRDTLPSLKQRRGELEDDIATLKEQIAEKEAEIDSADGSLDEGKETKAEIETTITELRSKQSKLDTVMTKIESREQTISQLESDLAEAESDLEACETTDAESLDAITSELSQLHEHVAQKESMMSELQNIIQFNKNFIDADSGTKDPLAAISSTDTIPDRDIVKSSLSAEGEQMVCWTCGSATSRSNISEMITRLQDIHEDLYGERERIRQQIDEQKERKQSIEEAKRRQSKLEDSIENITSQIEQNRNSLEQLRDRREQLEDEIASIEDNLTELREDREERVLDLHEELNNLEVDLQEATQEHASVVEEIADIEAEIQDIEPLRETIEELSDEIVELRERVDTIEADVIDQFNQHMDAVLDVLEYGNIERVWIEPRTVTTRDGRHVGESKRFELHVIREAEDGGTYEDTLAHLSESEREVTGLVFALAGYLVYEVYDTVPFMLLDSLEAIDSDRIATLIDYISEYADNLVVALLEEDAAALPGAYPRVS